MHSDLAGTFQALVSLWQILVRQQSIPDAQADTVFSGIVGGFASVKANCELFDAGRNGVKLLLAANAPNSDPHGKMLDLLAGNPADSETHDQMVQDLMRILEAQRIISLDTLFQLADHIEAVAKGEKLDAKLVNKLASRISEIQLPRASLSANEKNAMGFGYWTHRHLDAERKLNLRLPLRRPLAMPKKSGIPARCWRPFCAIPSSPSTTRTTRPREPRSFTPTPCSYAATISSACRAPITPGAPPNSTAAGGLPMPAGVWWDR